MLMAFMALTLVSAQDLDEILENYFETIGQEKILNTQSMRVSGKALMMGMEAPIEFTSVRPDKMRIEIDFQGNLIVQAYDGTTAWSINPTSGSAEAIELTGPQADGMIEQADMDGLLWNYEEKGHQLELDDTDEMDGTEVYVLKMTKKNGNIDYYYMDAENFVVLKMKSKTIMQGTEIETETLFSNFQDVDGYILPFTTEQLYGGQSAMTLSFENVEFDVDVDESIFSKPTSE